MAKQAKNQTQYHGKERRRFPRFALGCPARLFAPDGEFRGEPIARSRTDNIGNGGCYITLEEPPEFKINQTLRLELNIPRHTPNTYMLEPVRTAARITRIETPRPAETGLALEFEKPLELQLEE